jgi:ATP-dependent Clp protease ATP-binding subunit ClpB
VTPGAKEWLANRGYDPVFGARPMKRLIQKEVLDPLSMMLLGGELRDGEAVTVDNAGGKLVFHANMSQAPMVA